MAKQMVILVKGPGGSRSWLVAAQDDDEIASAYYVASEDELRSRLNLGPTDKLPTQIEIQTSALYVRRLAGQGLWR